MLLKMQSGKQDMIIMRILLVEDDETLCDTVGALLERAGYLVDVCYRGDDAIYYAVEHPYDAIVLDRMLPGVDGLTVLQRIRGKNIMTPVIITTALDGLHDRVDGLDAGADDYLVKPFAVEELLARIRAVTRRPGRTLTSEILQFSNLQLDTLNHSLSLWKTSDAGQPSEENLRPAVTLSKRESALLEYFMRNSGQTLPRNLILSYVWGPDSEVEEGNLDNYIYFLRRRLKTLHAKAKIRTIHGVGYRLEVSDD